MKKKLTRTPLFPDAEKGSYVFTPEETKRLRMEVSESVRLRDARRAEEKRRARMNLRFDTELKCYCGEPIVYQSTFHHIPGEWVAGAITGYDEERVIIFCDGCAVQYVATHKRFALVLKEAKRHRSVPEDWEPSENLKGEENDA